MQTNGDSSEIRSNRRSAVQKPNIRSSRSHIPRLWSTDIPNYDDFTSTKFVCKICKQVIKKELFEHAKTWWVRQLILMAMVFSGLKSKEDAKKEYQASVRNYKKGFVMEVHGGFFFICRDHLAHIGKRWLDILCIESPEDVMQADETIVGEAMDMMKFFNDKEFKFKTKEAFLDHCDLFISDKWHDICRMYCLRREVTYEDIQNEPIEDKISPDYTIQEELKVQTTSENMAVDPYKVVEEKDFSLTEKKPRNILVRNNANERSVKLEETDGDEMKVETQNHQSEPSERNRRDERRIKNREHQNENAVEESQSMSDTEPMTAGECDICGEHKTEAIVLKSDWNRRFLLYLAFKLKINKAIRCKRVFLQTESLLTCPEHAKRCSEEIFNIFGTEDQSKFLLMYQEHSNFKNNINRLYEDICRVFDLWYEERSAWIREVQAFVSAAEKGERKSVACPSPSMRAAETQSSESTSSTTVTPMSRRSDRFPSSSTRDESRRSFSIRPKSMRYASTRPDFSMDPTARP